MRADTSTSERERVRVLRARYDDSSITVYQAYPKEIAGPALASGTFVPPFKRERMTWIKPSFLWMMYRSGWAEKAGQERVLSIEITREGLEWALAHATLSHFSPETHTDEDSWRAQVREAPVRVQWDPDRSLELAPLATRAIQIGLSGEAVERYVDSWIVSITDITEHVRDVHSTVQAGLLTEAGAKLPVESAYPLPESIRRRIGADATPGE
ncbi:DUF4291 domain-containing protein [Streptomyces sp. HNM0575]|uniref:DUF4291 domain-containing protein n=1 Tax=Streptomyces sp. HNM0575 TaxID=2716338 RepID=UPI00145DADFB|nr:DUF4291 domain-containing protein [Streptomyces sp. HNM0575]NLU71301.1 DUF4291 domain-containing protein [Streptomyces sp. HNM0575]